MSEVQLGGPERVTTIPNLLSILRLALVPIFLGLLLEEQDVSALVVLAVSGLTDFFDGFLARRWNQVTDLGKVLDPIADHMTIFTAALGLAWREIVPAWLILVVLARDAFLLCVGFVLARFQLNPVPSSKVGKVATALLLVGMPVLVVATAVPASADVTRPTGLAVSIAAAALYWVAAGGYAIASAREIGERRDDRPDPSATLVSQRRSPDGG